MHCFIVGLVLCSSVVATYGYYYDYYGADPCSCDGSVPPSATTRKWIFKLSTANRPNKPPTAAYSSVIVDVISSIQGSTPYSSIYARLNALKTDCGDPLDLDPNCEYQSTLYLKTINGVNHFIIDRCNPPVKRYCICYP